MITAAASARCRVAVYSEEQFIAKMRAAVDGLCTAAGTTDVVEALYAARNWRSGLPGRLHYEELGDLVGLAGLAGFPYVNHRGPALRPGPTITPTGLYHLGTLMQALKTGTLPARDR